MLCNAHEYMINVATPVPIDDYHSNSNDSKYIDIDLYNN